MATESTFIQLEAGEQKRLLEKLAKLKALSECRTGNVNETATAAATMTRIMLEYQIQMADLEVGETSGTDHQVVDESILSDSHNGYPLWKKSILSALAEVNHCLSYTAHEPDADPWVRRTRSRLSVVGAPKDVESTRRLFVFCIDEVERLCYMWGPRQSVKRRNDFKRGAAVGIAAKVLSERDQVMREERQRAEAQEHQSSALALFERKEQAVAKFAAGLGIRTVSCRTRAPSREAYQAGYQAGASMDLQRGARPGLPASRTSR